MRILIDGIGSKWLLQAQLIGYPLHSDIVMPYHFAYGSQEVQEKYILQNWFLATISEPIAMTETGWKDQICRECAVHPHRSQGDY